MRGSHPATDLGHILRTHVLLLAAVAVTSQPAALSGLAGAVVAPLRVDTEVLAGPVPVVGDTLVGVHTDVAVLAQLVAARAGTQVGTRPGSYHCINSDKGYIDIDFVLIFNSGSLENTTHILVS